MDNKRVFGTDTSKLLKILTHGLYNDQDVFIRELISNSFDACEKINLKIASNNYNLQEYKAKILINCDENEKTITFIDNGIGMNEEDMHSFLGTIASSDTEKKIKELENNSSLVGQFGIGFYSAFIVADKVEVYSKKYENNQGYLWTSNGEDGYEITTSENPLLKWEFPHGTQVKLHLKEDKFANKIILKDTISKYSNYIKVPIYFYDEQEGNSTLNEANIPWQKKQMNQDESLDVYRKKLQGMRDLYCTIHEHLEGTYEYTVLMFIPAKNDYIPVNLDSNQSMVQIYSKGVFIYEENALLPTYLRFVRGIIEAKDFPLTVSRDMIKNSAFIRHVVKTLKSKILKELVKKSEKSREEYLEKFWKAYGIILKEGLYEEYTDKTLLFDACLFYSAKKQIYISMPEYLKEMDENQKDIYYFYNKGEIKHDIVDIFIQKNNCDVLMLADPLEKVCFDNCRTYLEYNLTAVKDNQVIDEEEKTEIENKLLNKIKSILNQEICEVGYTTNIPDFKIGLLTYENNFMAFNPQNKPKFKMILNKKNIVYQSLINLMANEIDNDKEIENIVFATYNLMQISENSTDEHKDAVYNLIVNPFLNKISNSSMK